MRAPGRHGRGHGGGGRQHGGAAVAPVEVGAADVAHLDLPAGRVVGRVGEDAALEGLHQHPVILRADVDADPVGLGQRVAHREQPVDDEVVLHVAGVMIRGAALVHELPEDVGDVMAQRRVVGRVAAVAGQIVEAADRAPAVERLANGLAGAVRRAVVILQRGDGGEGRVGGRIPAGGGIPGDGDVRGRHLHEGLIADLYPAADHVDDQQAVGDEPLGVAVGSGVVDLHAALVEVGDQMLPAGAFDIRLVGGVEARRAPGPRAGGDTVLHRLITVVPAVLEGRVGEGGRRRGGRRPGGHKRCETQHQAQQHERAAHDMVVG